MSTISSLQFTPVTRHLKAVGEFFASVGSVWFQSYNTFMGWARVICWQ